MIISFHKLRSEVFSQQYVNERQQQSHTCRLIPPKQSRIGEQKIKTLGNTEAAVQRKSILLCLFAHQTVLEGFLLVLNTLYVTSCTDQL